jgi:hypothetical protein
MECGDGLGYEQGQSEYTMGGFQNGIRLPFFVCGSRLQI